jgi:hypothetical protein
MLSPWTWRSASQKCSVFHRLTSRGASKAKSGLYSPCRLSSPRLNRHPERRTQVLQNCADTRLCDFANSASPWGTSSAGAKRNPRQRASSPLPSESRRALRIAQTEACMGLRRPAALWSSPAIMGVALSFNSPLPYRAEQPGLNRRYSISRRRSRTWWITCRE